MTPPNVAVMTKSPPPATAPTAVTVERVGHAKEPRSPGPLSLNTVDTWGEVDMGIDAPLDNDGRPPSRQKSPFPTGLDFERNGPRQAFHDPVGGSVASPVKISDMAGCASPAQKMHVNEVMETLNSSGGGRPVSRQVRTNRQKIKGGTHTTPTFPALNILPPNAYVGHATAEDRSAARRVAILHCEHERCDGKRTGHADATRPL